MVLEFAMNPSESNPKIPSDGHMAGTVDPRKMQDFCSVVSAPCIGLHKQLYHMRFATLQDCIRMITRLVGIYFLCDTDGSSSGNYSRCANDVHKDSSSDKRCYYRVHFEL